MIGFPYQPTRHCRFCGVEIDSETKYYYERVCEAEGCVTLESMDVDRQKSAWSDTSSHYIGNAIDIVSNHLRENHMKAIEDYLWSKFSDTDSIHADFGDTDA